MQSRKHIESRNKALNERANILDSATVYLSGPMDFVESRELERANGWRTRITDFLKVLGTTIYDPWEKPEVSGMKHYGKEDEFTADRRNDWTYEPGEKGDKLRAQLADEFWPTLHIDLRMTDLADFLIAYCPTNIYSVGTVHEIALARQQHKPVLLVTPPINYTAWNSLKEQVSALDDDNDIKKTFNEFQREIPIRPNALAAPSLWYMALVEKEDYFFDGFGWDYIKSDSRFSELNWKHYAPLDDREIDNPPKRPLLPYLAALNSRIPQSFDLEKDSKTDNVDWLIFVDDLKIKIEDDE